jgi:hypothetical protein
LSIDRRPGPHGERSCLRDFGAAAVGAHARVARGQDAVYRRPIGPPRRPRTGLGQRGRARGERARASAAVCQMHWRAGCVRDDPEINPAAPPASMADGAATGERDFCTSPRILQKSWGGAPRLLKQKLCRYKNRKSPGSREPILSVLRPPKNVSRTHRAPRARPPGRLPTRPTLPRPAAWRPRASQEPAPPAGGGPWRAYTPSIAILACRLYGKKPASLAVAPTERKKNTTGIHAVPWPARFVITRSRNLRGRRPPVINA